MAGSLDFVLSNGWACPNSLTTRVDSAKVSSLRPSTARSISFYPGSAIDVVLATRVIALRVVPQMVSEILHLQHCSVSFTPFPNTPPRQKKTAALSTNRVLLLSGHHRPPCAVGPCCHRCPCRPARVQSGSVPVFVGARSSGLSVLAECRCTLFFVATVVTADQRSS